jgi:hypothetical protein
VLAIAAVSVACLVAFTLGWRFRISAPLAALGLLWSLSYRNAWGMVFHTDNLLVLHVIALACAPAADAWAIGVRAPRPVPPAGYGWAIKLLAALTVATYVLAGIAKLRLGGLAWAGGEQLRNQIAIARRCSAAWSRRSRACSSLTPTRSPGSRSARSSSSSARRSRSSVAASRACGPPRRGASTSASCSR